MCRVLFAAGEVEWSEDLGPRRQSCRHLGWLTTSLGGVGAKRFNFISLDWGFGIAGGEEGRIGQGYKKEAMSVNTSTLYISHCTSF